MDCKRAAAAIRGWVPSGRCKRAGLRGNVSARQGSAHLRAMPPELALHMRLFSPLASFVLDLLLRCYRFAQNGGRALRSINPPAPIA